MIRLIARVVLGVSLGIFVGGLIHLFTAGFSYLFVIEMLTSMFCFGFTFAWVWLLKPFIGNTER